jgi:phage terminase large subunit-like protein
MGAIDPRYPPPERKASAEQILGQGQGAWAQYLAELSTQQLAELGNPLHGACNWNFWARDEQLAPTGNWSTWFYLAGRGTGKTRSGSEWVLDQVRNGIKIIHLVAPTEADYRDVMIHGPAGLIAIAPPDLKPQTAGPRKLVFPNGAYALCFSAEQPERLRGPQCGAAWCDEVAAWRYVDHTWDMMSFGLRLGASPRVMVSTTPKPIPLIKRLVKDPMCAVTRGTTYDNKANLAPKFFEDTVKRYEGTRLARQELMADILTDNPDALFTYTQLDRLRVRHLDECSLPFRRVVVAVDPPMSTGDVTKGVEPDECGIIVAGLGDNGHAYVLDDRSSRGDPPSTWARKVLDAYWLWNANCIVVEVNQGGNLVREVIEQANRQYKRLPVLPIREVHAKPSKVTRAEPVEMLYQQGRVHHLGSFGPLEDQMCNFTIDFDPKKSGYSPDRLDALVYAINELIVRASAPGLVGRLGQRMR